MKIQEMTFIINDFFVKLILIFLAILILFCILFFILKILFLYIINLLKRMQIKFNKFTHKLKT